jgi:hypothetical protein
MFDQRLQLLLTAEQRHTLEAEAQRRGASVASLIREAIDAHYGAVAAEERVRAVEEIAAMEGGSSLSPEELDRLAEEERDQVVDSMPGLPGR